MDGIPKLTELATGPAHGLPFTARKELWGL